MRASGLVPNSHTILRRWKSLSNTRTAYLVLEITKKFVVIFQCVTRGRCRRVCRDGGFWHRALETIEHRFSHHQVEGPSPTTESMVALSRSARDCRMRVTHPHSDRRRWLPPLSEQSPEPWSLRHGARCRPPQCLAQLFQTFGRQSSVPSGLRQNGTWPLDSRLAHWQKSSMSASLSRRCRRCSTVVRKGPAAAFRLVTRHRPWRTTSPECRCEPRGKEAEQLRGSDVLRSLHLAERIFRPELLSSRR